MVQARKAALALLCIAAAALLSVSARAADGDAVEAFDTTEDALESIRQVFAPETESESVSEVITKFFPEAEVDEGTYPLSEFEDENFDLLRGDPAKLSYSGRVFTKYSDDNISGKTKWEKEIELNLNYKELDGYFRFSDVNAFAYQNDPFRWEKAQVRYKVDKTDTQITIGTFGALFGRGMALNMFEDRTLEFDNEAEGIKVQQAIGAGELTALRGSRKLRDELTASEVQAVGIAGPLTSELDLGAHVVQVQVQDHNSAPTKLINNHYELLGADATWRPGDFRFYGEVAGLRREVNDDATGVNKTGEDGLGYYLNGGYSQPGFSMDAEYKDYRKLDQPFSVLPPVRRWNEQATADPKSDLGYGFGLNWAPVDDGSLVNLHYAQDNSVGGSRPYTEMLSSYSSPTDSDTTWVAENWQIQILGDKHRFNRLTVNQVFDDDWSGSMLIEQERRHLFHNDAFNDWTFEPEIAFQSKFNLIYTYEFTGDGSILPEQRKEWQLWEAKYRPDDDQEFNVVWGARQAGFVCSGGICRQEPEFSGIRLDWLLRF